MQNISEVWLPHKILYIVKEAQMGKDYFTYGKDNPCKTLRGMEDSPKIWHVVWEV